MQNYLLILALSLQCAVIGANANSLANARKIPFDSKFSCKCKANSICFGILLQAQSKFYLLRNSLASARQILFGFEFLISERKHIFINFFLTSGMH